MSYRLTWARYCLVLFLVLLFCFSSTIAFSAVFYVDASSQNPLKDGNIDSPFVSIQNAINASSSGDTIYITEGIYDGDLVVDGKGISLVGENPLNTIISGAANTIDISGVFSSGGSVEIRGLTIKNGSARGVYFHSATLVATIKNCIIINNGQGISVASTGSKVNILNNVITNNTGNGIWADDYGDNPSINIYNNIITKNTLRGVYISDAYANCFYNNAWSNLTGDIVGCDLESNNISDDPVFLNSDTGDFRLSSTSTSIDSGTSSMVDVDPDGTRNDLGAFGGPGSANFWPATAGGPVVTNLIITTPSIPTGGTLSFQATGEIK